MDIRQLIDKINHFENKQILNEGVVNDMTEGGTFDEQELSDVLKAFDEQVNEIGGNGIPDYDKIISALDNGDIEAAMEEIVSAYSDQDGGEIRSNDYDNYLEDLESEFKFLVYSNPSGRVRPNDESNSENDIQPGMKVSQGTVVKVNGNTVTVKTSNGDMMNMNIHDIDQAVAESEDYATFEDRKNQTSIYKTLIKEFGYELDERAGDEPMSDADYAKQMAQGQKNWNSVKGVFGGGSSVDIGKQQTWQQMGADPKEFAKNAPTWKEMGTDPKDFAKNIGIAPAANAAAAVTMADIQAAVGQEKDEQKRAAILNDLAQKKNLPGLYDPVSGYFVRKQQPPSGDHGRNNYEISATAREADTQALAKMGLVPGNAKTSALGGVIGTGKNSWGGLDKEQSAANDTASRDVKQQSANVQGGQRSNTFYAPKIARLKELIDKISSTAESIIFNSTIARSLVESFNYTLAEKMTLGTGPAVTNQATGVTAGKFQAEVAEINKIIGELGNADELPPEVSQVVQGAQAAVTKLAAPASAPAPAPAPAPATAPAAGKPGSASAAAPAKAEAPPEASMGAGSGAPRVGSNTTTAAAPDDSPEASLGAGSGAPRVGPNTTIPANSNAANDERDGVLAAPAPAAPAASTWKGQTDEFGGMEEKPKAAAPAAAPAAAAPAPGSGYDPRMAAYDRISKFSGQLTPAAAPPTAAAPTAGAEEKKIARFKELLDKAKTASVTTPAATKESIGYFLNKLRFIESRQLNEALTPEEQKEMDGLYAELGQQGSENNPAIVKLINDYNSITVKPAAAAPAAAAPSAAAPVTTPGQGGGRPADAAAMANANWTHVLQGSDVSFAIDNGFGYDVAKWKAAGSPGKPKPADSAPPAGSLTGDDQLSINQQNTLNKQMAKPEAPAYKGNAGAQEIQKLNPAIKDVNKIYPGQKFKMPDGSTYTVKPGDTLDKIAKGAKPAGEEAAKMPPTKQQDPTGRAQAAAPAGPAQPAAPASAPALAPFDINRLKQLSGQPAAPGQSGQPPVMDPNKPGFDFKKASAAANAKKESVRNQDDAILERIRSALKF